MFKHSVKVPRNYKIAANIVKKVSTEGGSVKTLLYDDKLRHFRTNVLYALINETVKHAAEIDKIFESCGLFTKEPRLDPWLAKVLTAELLYGKKELPGDSKPVQTILSYKDQFAQHTTPDSTTKAVRRPRYVRINTNLLTTSDAIRAFQDEGYRFVRCTSGSYNDYLTQIQQLDEFDFTQDYHVKTMFVFPTGTKLHEHDLYLENKIVLQDKATAMAVHLLGAPPGSAVLDMCAAPGMKTTQLAASMRNQGKIYAVERNEKRYQTLCDFVEKTGAKCVEPLHKDCLEIRRGDYEDVEYIILDPSCSGSGMELSVHNYIDATRLAKLTSLQEKFLKHAMNAFPKAKRIVYSTCSLFPEENERVITNVVKASRAKWIVHDTKEMLKGQWNNFGSSMYGGMGARCLYAKPDSDFTIGFFLAVLDRDQKDMEKYLNSAKEGETKEINDDDESNDHDKKMKKQKKNKRKAEDDDVTVATNENNLHEDDESSDREDKKRKPKTKYQLEDSAVTVLEDSKKNDDEDSQTESKKKTRKSKLKNIQNTKEFETDTVEKGKQKLDQEDLHLEDEKKKTKKNKYINSNADYVNDNLKDLEDSTKVEDEDYQTPSKKKRKNKINDTEYTNESHQCLETETFDEVPEKKNKVKKHKSYENGDEPEAAEKFAENVYNKKKQKRIRTEDPLAETNEETKQNNTGSIEKSAKKKKQKRLETEL